MKNSTRMQGAAAALLFGMSAAGMAGIFADSGVHFEKAASELVSIHATQLFSRADGADVTGYVTLAMPTGQRNLGYVTVQVIGNDGKVTETGYGVLRPSAIAKYSQARFEAHLSQVPAKDATISVSYVE